MAALAERDEAIAQQAAASEVFQIINASEGDLAPVFEAIVERAMRLCGAPSGGMWLLNGDRARAVGARNLPVAYLEFLNREPVSPSQIFGRTVQGRPFLHITDLSATEAYRNRVPLTVASVELGSIRTYLGVPLREGGAVVGIINLFRQEVRPFTERQIALVQSFAIQAEIAMMNARHINETREALARQTATAEILRVISQSPTDARPVFDKILDACQRLFGSEQIGVFTIEDEMVRVAAWRGPRPEEALRDVTPFAESITGRVIRERRIHHIPDTRNIPNLSKMRRDNVDRFGGESLLYAPMLWEERGLGSILVARPAPKPFSDKEQALLQSFADQAAIAIQNARLFNETQARTRDLAEALQQQTATSDVLKVISRAAFDLQSVLDTLASSAAALCGASNGLIYLQSGDTFELKAATKSWNPETFRLLSETPQRPGRRTVGARVLLTGEVQNVADMQVDPDYDPAIRALSASRALLGVPLKRGDAIIGAFVLSRREAGAYSQRQVQIVQTFADQAVIAIENARLFDEVQARTRDLEEALQQQTATANVLKVISRSAFDLQAVFDALISSAVNLIGSQQGTIYVRDGDDFRIRAHYGVTPEFVEFLISNTPTPGMGSASGRVMLTGKVVAIPDILEDEDYALPANALNRTRSMLAAPLLRDDRVEGVLIIARTEPGAFSPRQIELVQTFADQAGIAIENARLFDEVQARTRDLEEALQQQTATADVLKVISRSAFDLQAVFETLLSSAIALSGAWQGTICIRDGDGFTYRAVSTAVGTEEFDEKIRENLLNLQGKADRTTLAGRAILSGQVEQIEDIFEDPEYWLQGSAAEAAGIRAVLGVPLLRDDRPEGALVLSRRQPGRFAPRVVELVRSFADQAVIAIENVRLFDEVQARTRDLTEALQQQTATAEVLKVISRSAFDLQPILDTLVETAARLCQADLASINIRDGEVYRVAASFDYSPELSTYARNFPMTPGRGTVTGRAALERRVVHVADLAADAEYAAPGWVSYGKVRTALGVPLLRDGEPIGMIFLARRRVEPFTERQIELVRTFADQAVIAIENVRLFDEVQARTRDLEEALEQKTASAEILRVISSSPTDARPVFETILRTARKLCDAERAIVHILRDGAYHAVAVDGRRETGHDESLADHPILPGRGSITGRVVQERRVVHIHDVKADPEFTYLREAGFEFRRTMLGVPLLREGQVIGVIVLQRSVVQPFTTTHIDLVTTFADQAMIAVENVRLFDEVQAKSRDLEEALQQQTATSDVLKVISRSAFDLDAVLNSLTKSAVELCNSTYGVISLYRDGVLKFMAQTGCTPEFAELLWNNPAPLDRKSTTGRAGLLRTVVLVPDVTQDEEYDYHGGEIIGNYRSMMGVPLLRNGELEGVFTLMRRDPGTFTPRQIELVQTFADQAVIAIENARLFDEVQAKTRDLEEALQLQTATSEVLKVISRSAFDLQAVFDTLTASAVELCGAFSGSICVRDGDVYRYRGNAGPGLSVAMSQYLAEHPATPGRGSIVGRVLLLGKVAEIPDVLEDADYVVPLGAHGQVSRALLGVPLLGKDGIEGGLVLTRKEPGHFTPRQIEIVQTFADQAVIAIENVRLFDEVQARTKELAASLDDLRRAQDRLIQSEKLASLGQLTAGIAHEIKNPLNFVNNYSTLSRELTDELAEALARAPLEDPQRREAEALMRMIGANLDKVVHHGKRADSIVKNMLLHSREGSGERSSVNVNAMVEESLNLAYHGARAEKPGFNVTIAKSLDPQAGDADLYPQEMTRVLLNLISNGFYATTMRKRGEESGTYEPTISASTRDAGDRVEIVIRDNGTGIPDEVKTKMFNPFFTTKPAGEGTGLGLSLSHDIVVKQHGGTLDVSTEPGSHTQFTIVLPRAPQGAPAKAGASA